MNETNKSSAQVRDADYMTAAVDAAMIEMKNISPPLRRSECKRLIAAALAAAQLPAQGTVTDAQAVAIAETPDVDAAFWNFRKSMNVTTMIQLIQAIRAAPAQQPTDSATETVEAPWREVLQGFVDHHTKPAGLTVELIRDTKQLGAFLGRIEASEADLVARAIELLDRPTAPPK